MTEHYQSTKHEHFNIPSGSGNPESQVSLDDATASGLKGSSCTQPLAHSIVECLELADCVQHLYRFSIDLGCMTLCRELLGRGPQPQLKLIILSPQPACSKGRAATHKLHGETMQMLTGTFRKLLEQLEAMMQITAAAMLCEGGFESNLWLGLLIAPLSKHLHHQQMVMHPCRIWPNQRPEQSAAYGCMDLFCVPFEIVLVAVLKSRQGLTSLQWPCTLSNEYSANCHVLVNGQAQRGCQDP